MFRDSYKKAGVVIIALMPWLVSLAHASNTCALTQNDFKQLSTAPTDTGTNYLERIKEELVVRRALLQQTVDCAIAEANGLRSGLASVSTDDPQIKSIGSELAGRIADAINYYEAEKTKIAGLGLTGSRTFAQNLRDWREGNYKPAAKEGAILVLWFRNQDLILKAQTRIDQIGGTMVVLKIVNSEEIQGVWKEAENNFHGALSANQKATASIKGRDPGKAMEFMHDSLIALAQTYQKFLDISKVFNPSLRQ